LSRLTRNEQLPARITIRSPPTCPYVDFRTAIYSFVAILPFSFLTSLRSNVRVVLSSRHGHAVPCIRHRGRSSASWPNAVRRAVFVNDGPSPAVPHNARSDRSYSLPSVSVVNGESYDVTCTYSQQFGVCLYCSIELCHQGASTDHLFCIILDSYVGYKHIWNTCYVRRHCFSIFAVTGVLSKIILWCNK
jgi:hypothetical protein